jgi:hypothetical protein
LWLVVAGAFKNLIDAHTVVATARHLQRVWPDFDARRIMKVNRELFHDPGRCPAS